jgi:putative transposase
VKCAFIQRHKRIWPIRVQCRVLGISVSGYHQHLARRPQIARRRHLSDEALLAHISAAYAENRGAYGWPRIWRELIKRGIRVGKQRVQRLMQQHGIQARGKRRFRVTTTTDSRHDLPIAPNLLNRNFTAAAPNQAWVGDFTYIRDRRGRAVPGRGHRSVQPKSGGLVDAACHAARSGHRRLGDGQVPAPPGQECRPDLS